MDRLNRSLCYLLLLGVPLLVFISDINSPELRYAIYAAPQKIKHLLYLRLMYFPPKYFLWGMISACMLLLVFFQRAKFEWKFSHALLFILWGWWFSSFIWSANRYISLESFTQWSLIFVFIFLVSHMIKEWIHVKKALWMCLIGLSIVVSISLVEAYTNLISIHQQMGFRTSSTMGNYIFITHFCLIVLPFFAPLYFRSSSAAQVPTREKLALISIWVLLITHVVLIGFKSKGLWLGLFFDMGFILFYFLKKIPHFKKVAYSSLGVLFMIMVCFGIRSYQKISPDGFSSTIQQRWIMWRNTVAAIKDSPFLGTGLGTFPIIYSKYEDSEDRKLYPRDETGGWPFFTRQAHNDILQIAQECGLIGLFFFLYFIFSIAIIGFQEIKKARERNQKILIGALLLSLCHFLILSLVYFPFHEPMSALLFGLIVGLLIGQRVSQKHSVEISPLTFFIKPAQIVLTYGGGLLLIPFFLVTSFGYFLSEWHWQKAHFNSKSFEEIDHQIEKAFFWNPKDWEKLWGAGVYYLRQDRFVKARDTLLEATRLHPYLPHLPYNLALAYLNLSDSSKALTYFNRAIALAPDYVFSYYQMGLLFYERRKNPKKALKFFKRAQMLSSSILDESFYMAALCQASLNRPRLAKKELIEAIALNPTQIEYHRFLDFLDKNFQRNWIPPQIQSSVSAFQERLHSGDRKEILGALSLAASVPNAEKLTWPIFNLLMHEDRVIKMEATQFFLSLPKEALAPLLENYSKIEDLELRWRVFYILSEKVPQKMLYEARQVFRGKPDVSPQLRVLSIRLLSKFSPDELVYPSPTGKTDYALIRFYAFN